MRGKSREIWVTQIYFLVNPSPTELWKMSERTACNGLSAKDPGSLDSMPSHYPVLVLTETESSGLEHVFDLYFMI
jgi:hypothetical protein